MEEGIEILSPDPSGVEEWAQRSDAVLNEMLEADEFEVPGLDRLRERLEAIRAEEGAEAP
jgi:hypothetical protein